MSRLEETPERATGFLACDITWRHEAEEDQTQQVQSQRVNGYAVYKADIVLPMAKDDTGFFRRFGAEAEASVRRNVEATGKFSNEVDLLGGAWRGLLRRIMLMVYDDTNALLLSRGLQLAPFFLAGYEAYLLTQLIEALDPEASLDTGSSDKRSKVAKVLAQAFQNRNITRLVVQNLSARYDFVWHLDTAITRNREFDLWAQLPLVGVTQFPATENFPGTRDHALASIFRTVLGPGNWITRIVTGREGLITDNPTAVAQNLAPESNGFELANRNQYGTYIGRNKTNAFRFEHRLPTDESILRTFVTQPLSTLTNNGVVHVIRQVAKHWENMLNQEWGNFGHQRMEQLDPFEALRFHMPTVLLVLSSLRGRNREDSQILGPTIHELQRLRGGEMDVDTALQLVDERLLNMHFVTSVTGGIQSIAEPFRRWLEAIRRALVEIEEQARTIDTIIMTVEHGIRIGYDLLSKVDWTVPKDEELGRAVVSLVQNIDTNEAPAVRRAAQRALDLMRPRDKRTLIELFVKQGRGNSKPAKLLISRVVTLLQRELRRDSLCQAIRKASTGGDAVSSRDLVQDEWYWIIEEGPAKDYVYFFTGVKKKGPVMVHADSGYERTVSLEDIERGRLSFRRYIPVGEAIVRAQKAFMNIELDHGRRFKYAAFMEFNTLRARLRQFVAVSQMSCEELDDARLKLLREAQRSNGTRVEHRELVRGRTYHYQSKDTGKYYAFVFDGKRIPGHNVVKVPPQSVIVVGGGPTGLLSTIHCTESCLVTGGKMKLYEDRDAFPKGGATFERAQVVRLDPRWIAMLRFYLGTAFEDVFTPSSGETDSQLGNTLPTEGFVEITIKDLETMLHIEIAKLWSAGLISVSTKSKAQYDHETGSLTKLGANLKKEDVILRYVDQNGIRSDVPHSWRVADVISEVPITEVPAQRIGNEFGIYVQSEEQVLPFRLVAVDIDKFYTFKSTTAGVEDLTCEWRRLPSIYEAGQVLNAHSNIRSVVFECVRKSELEQHYYVQHTVLMTSIRERSFILDIGQTHVFEATGKPKKKKVHLTLTNDEPYGVCCMQGLKISMGMHNFGGKRWGSGVIDDVRSRGDQNTRIVGDFTKMVRVQPIAKQMHDALSIKGSGRKNWQLHFEKLMLLYFPQSTAPAILAAFTNIVNACGMLKMDAQKYRRQTLQTRFFETGDIVYLGMEFPREYAVWKAELGSKIVKPMKEQDLRSTWDRSQQIEKLKIAFMKQIDRLWYEACLEIIRHGDVYNPGARSRVPSFYIIDSNVDVRLSSLPVGESFRCRVNEDNEKSREKYEVLVKSAFADTIVRDVEGHLSTMKPSDRVYRQANLTRGPNGNQESKVAIDTFNVEHLVAHRSMRLTDRYQGFVAVFAGDGQAAPHFMRYSGLTGAGINAMSFNNFLKGSLAGTSFSDRFSTYLKETDWSNSEVVTRGTGSNFGIDGFLRPGFSYADAVDYFYAKIVECFESGSDKDRILSPEWKNKFAAAMVPRGMQEDLTFITALRAQFNVCVTEKFFDAIKRDPHLAGHEIEAILRGLYSDVGARAFWARELPRLQSDEKTRVIIDSHTGIANRVVGLCEEVIRYAQDSFDQNERVSSQLFLQPKPVDSVVDDFAVEAQNFANSLTQSAAIASGSLALTLQDNSEVSSTAALVLGIFNISVAFGSITNVSRYKIRNEETRILIEKDSFTNLLKAVFSLMNRETRESVPQDQNPFLVELETTVKEFRECLVYYGLDLPETFDHNYQRATSRDGINNMDQILAWRTLIASDFIPGITNGYVQDSLVAICKELDEMLFMLGRQHKVVVDSEAKQLFNRLVAFRSRLNASLQTGLVRFGFLKQRDFAHWDVIVAVRNFVSLFWRLDRRNAMRWAPIQSETLGILEQTKELAERCGGLHREVQDLTTLYWATRESDISSLIFLLAVTVFIASILFSFARVFNVETLEDIAFWALLASTMGALLAVQHLGRKLAILVRLHGQLGQKPASIDLTKVSKVTAIQITFTVARLATALLAAVALPLSLAKRFFDFGAPNIPESIAFCSLVLAGASGIIFLFVEFGVRYNLPVTLGPFVCGLFREEIEEFHLAAAKGQSRPRDARTCEKMREIETWEYTARMFLHQYRFDAVFAADRFGSILQYIQSGMEDYKPDAPRNDEAI